MAFIVILSPHWKFSTLGKSDVWVFNRKISQYLLNIALYACPVWLLNVMIGRFFKVTEPWDQLTTTNEHD